MNKLIGYTLLILGVLLLLWMLLPFALLIVKILVVGVAAIFALYLGMKLLAKEG